MGVAGTITGLLVYYALVSGIARVCAARRCSSAASFIAGAGATIALSIAVLAISSAYWGRLMLVNDSTLITGTGVAALGVLGGLRCLGLVAKSGSVHET